MIAQVSGLSEINEPELPLDLNNPAFRKATSNMLAALFVCQKSLAILNPVQKASLSLIVSTQFGEVSASLEFLTTFYDSKIAKPILFQNSLHNSTLGFVTIQLGLQGPAMTLSADEHMDESIRETAAGLLTLTDHVLICQVDIVPDFVKENYAAAYPQLKDHLNGARAFIVSKPEIKIDSATLKTDWSKFEYSEQLKTMQKVIRV